jgi:hypothetical protein
MTNVYESFIAEVEALTINATDSAVSVVGVLTRAVKRAQMVADGELRPVSERVQGVANLTDLGRARVDEMITPEQDTQR